MGTFIHGAGAIGGILFLPSLPILLPLATMAGSFIAVEAAGDYVELLPPKEREERHVTAPGMVLPIVGSASYVVGEAALATLAVALLGSGRFESPETADRVATAAGITAGVAFLGGLTATSIATWSAFSLPR
jgi:hypothetical protein